MPTSASRLLRLATVVVAFSLLSAGCGGGAGTPGSGSSSTNVAPLTTAPGSTASTSTGGLHSSGAGPTPSSVPTSPSGFQLHDNAIKGLVSADATWNAPDHFTVDKTQRVALTIGDPGQLAGEVARLAPNTSAHPEGKVSVGPDVKVTLLADPNDADIAPKDAIDTSTGRDVRLAFSWTVHPRHPDNQMPLTAEVVVALANGAPVTTDIPLNIDVKGTPGYTVGKAWPVVASVVAVLVGVVALWQATSGPRKRHRKRVRRKRLASAAKLPLHRPYGGEDEPAAPNLGSRPERPKKDSGVQ